MMFFQPIWFLLVIPLAVTLFLWRMRSRTLLVIRILFLAALVLAMADTAIRLPRKNGTVVVITDRSRSMPAGSREQQQEAVSIIRKYQGAHDRLAVVSFAEKPVVEKLSGSEKFEGLKAKFSGDRSDLVQALQTAETMIPEDASGRILLISDGRWTGASPEIAFARLAGRNIPVDYRILRNPAGNDLAISRIDAPHNVAPKEYFPVRLELKAPLGGTVVYRVSRNNKVVFSGRREVTAGMNQLFFRDKSDSPQVLDYKVTVNYEKHGDERSENNSAEFIVKAAGEQPLLLVTMSKQSSLAKIMQRAGISCKVKLPEECTFSLSELAGCSGVILENVPTQKIGLSGMENIAEWIKNSGGGLMITGGRNSYGMGGYYQSPLDAVMPVSMELKKEHRKFAMALAVVLDRSGSMTMSVPGGRTKMDLANMATAEVFDMLSDNDEFGVIAVDSSPHVIIPLKEKSDLSGADRKIMKIDSLGGGIFVYSGLVDGVKMLMSSKAGTRHIILFADAADAEEPGKYKELLEKCNKAGITVSVMALGRKSDSDADFLIDVAKRGLGRIYFTENANELPRLFAQDTFVIARNSFVDEPAMVKFTGAMFNITSDKFGRVFELGGFNLCYLKSGADAGAISADEYSAPIVAFQQVGTGRVLCYTGEVDGEYTGKFAAWPQAGDFLAALVRWTSGGSAGNRIGDSMLFTQELKNGVHRIALHLDPDRHNDPFKKLPQLAVMLGTPGQKPETKKVKMRWEDADTLVTEVPMDSMQTNLTSAHIEGFKPYTLAPVKLMYSPEFEPPKEERRQYSIPRLAAMTGGKERVDLASIWSDMPVSMSTKPIAKWLLLTALILLLAEVLERRTAALSKALAVVFKARADRKPVTNDGSARIKAESRKVKKSKQKSKNVGTSAQAKPEKVPVAKDAEASDENSMLDALKKAKNKTRTH